MKTAVSETKNNSFYAISLACVSWQACVNWRMPVNWWAVPGLLAGCSRVRDGLLIERRPSIKTCHEKIWNPLFLVADTAVFMKISFWNYFEAVWKHLHTNTCIIMWKTMFYKVLHAPLVSTINVMNTLSDVGSNENGEESSQLRVIINDG